MLEALDTLVQEKKALVDKIKGQMQEDLKSGKLSPRAIECFHNAELSLASIEAQPNDAAAFQLFWRAAWNLGELMALKPQKE